MAIEDHFEGLMKIAGGLQAEIFKAIDKESGAVVAVKRFKDSQRGAFMCEIASLRLLHPFSLKHVIPLKLVHWEEIAAFPFFKHGELYSYIHTIGFMEEILARTLFYQLLLALGSIHSCGVVHRDIKPENVLIDDDFNIILADFGLSAVISPNVPIGSQPLTAYCGSTSYMVPQMFNESIKYDGRQADVWSAGCVLFAMVTGNNPFLKAAPGDWWFNQIANSRRERFWEYHRKYSLQTLSEDLVKFLDRIFVIDELDRATVNDLLSDPWMMKERLSNEALHTTMKSIAIQFNITNYS
jgi:serine/threonine protein kinase